MRAESHTIFPACLSSVVLGLTISIVAVAQTAPLPQSAALENTLVQAQGLPSIYLVHAGKKYAIADSGWISKNGYRGQDVHILNPAEVDAIPSAYELKLDAPIPGTLAAIEGRLISAPDGRIFVVEHGKRRYVTDGRWIAKSRYAGQAAISVSDAELQALPIGGRDLTYTPPGETLLIFVLTIALCVFFLLLRSSRIREHSLFRGPSAALARTTILINWTPGRTRIFILFIFVVVIALREPYLLLHPRFWAEEGTNWFPYAASHSVFQTLLFTHPLSGYFNLLANIAAVLSSTTARLFGLEYAPAATTLVAFLIQAIAIALILFGASQLFDSLGMAVAGCFIVLFASTATDEIWLNTINSMSYLGLISLLLLFGRVWTWPTWLKWTGRGLLTLCGLSSPYSAALLPLFGIAAFYDRVRERKIQALILTFCVVVQVGFVVSTRFEHTDIWTVRASGVRPDIAMVDVLCGHIVRPSLGALTQEALIDGIGLREAWTTATTPPPRPSTDSLPLAGWFCGLVIVIILWYLKEKAIYSTINMTLSAFLLLSALTCVSSLNAIPLGRYAFLPATTFLLLLLLNTELGKARIIPYICIAVLSYGLAYGIIQYRKFYMMPPSDPSWSSEVRAWRMDHSHSLRVWPSWWTETIPGNMVVDRGE